MSLNEAQFSDLIDELQNSFDTIVETGDDQELFISGYVNGHFSLVASQCFNEQAYSVAELDNKMQSSFNHAFADGELQEEDQEYARAFWQSCLQKIG